jgi:hypothetical protein
VADGNNELSLGYRVRLPGEAYPSQPHCAPHEIEPPASRLNEQKSLLGRHIFFSYPAMGMARLAQTTSTINYLTEIRLSLSNGSTSWRTIVIRERNGKYIRVGDVLEDIHHWHLRVTLAQSCKTRDCGRTSAERASICWMVDFSRPDLSWWERFRSESLCSMIIRVAAVSHLSSTYCTWPDTGFQK